MSPPTRPLGVYNVTTFGSHRGWLDVGSGPLSPFAWTATSSSRNSPHLMSTSPVVAPLEHSQPLDLDTEDHQPGSLYSWEIFWRDHQKWLEEIGYILRPRYKEGWTPSWTGQKRKPKTFEDYHTLYVAEIMDATRKSDGTVVVLKSIYKSTHPHEVDITQMFSSEALASDPQNHCVPIYDVLQSPHQGDVVFIVIPYLRTYNDPRLYTFGEAVELFRQLFEGVQFVHHHHVAHRDIMHKNIMMDPTPLVSETPHPIFNTLSYDMKRRLKFSTRTARPTKYYIIDFGISRRYPEDCTSPRELPIIGGDDTVPEFKGPLRPCDPFPTDIYYLGNFIRVHFIWKSYGFEFMQPLIADMVQDDPTKRPAIDEAVERFDKLRASLGTWKLRSRIVHKKDLEVLSLLRTVRHVYRTLKFIVTRTPPIPIP